MTLVSPDLFAGMEVDYGRPNFVSLAPARALLADVLELANVMDETFHDRCQGVASGARKLGAHSVARAVRWLACPDTLGRHGYDAMHYRAEDIARRWLRRLESSRALRTPPASEHAPQRSPRT